MFNAFETHVSHVVAEYHKALTAGFAGAATWYEEANAAAVNISRSTGIAVATIVAVIAALSPRNKWGRNLTDAAAMAAAYVAGGTSAASEVKVCTFNANKRKALAILAGASPDDVLSDSKGRVRKTLTFHRNILSPEASGRVEVTIDGHALAIMLGERITLDKVPPIASEKRWQYCQRVYLEAARRLGVRPSALQSVTWAGYRHRHGLKD